MSVFRLCRKYAGAIEGILLRILTADGDMTVAEAMSVSSSLQLSPGDIPSLPQQKTADCASKTLRSHTCMHIHV